MSVVEKIKSENLEPELRARVELVKADRLEALGRTDEAKELRAEWLPVYDREGEVDLFASEEDDDEAFADSADSAASADEAEDDADDLDESDAQDDEQGDLDEAELDEAEATAEADDETDEANRDA